MADEAEEVDLSDDDNSRGGGGDKGGKKGNKGKKGRVMGGPPRLFSGQLGAKIARGEPAVGPIYPIPTIKVPYPTAAEPAMLRRECVTHMPGSNYEIERAKMLNKAEVSLSMSYASASRQYASNGSGKKVAHIAWLAIPACKLAPNPSTLVDFRVENNSQMLWATSISFFLAALSNDAAHSTVQQRDASISLERGVFVSQDGTLQPRCQTFVHRIFAPDASGNSTWDDLVDSIPPDPQPGASAEEIARAKRPDVFAVNHVNHPSRFVGYLIQVIYHDPTLDPNVQIRTNIQRNRQLKGVDTIEVYEQALDSMLFRTNQEAMGPGRGGAIPIGPPPAVAGGGAPAAAAAAVPGSAGAPPSAYGLDDPAPAGEAGAAAPAAAAPAAADAKMSDGSEAEEVDDEDLDSEAEAREAAAMRKSVEERARRTKENPSGTEEGKRFAERMNALLSKEKGADAPKLKAPAAGGDAPADQESSSDGGSYQASKDGDEEDSLMGDANPDEAGSPAPTAANAAEGMEGVEEYADAKSEAGSGEEEEEEEDKGMTLDEMLKDAEDENGGEEDSEEKRELDAEEEKRKTRGSSSKKNKAKAKGGAALDSEEAKKLDAEERALKEESARLKKAGASDGPGVSRRFGLENKGADEDVKRQTDKERSAVKRRGPAYQDYEHERMQIAMRSQESLPSLFGRSILNLKLYSQIAVDAYLRAADSPECAAHPNGLYDTEANLNVRVFEYSMDVRSPLHYSNVLSFENARKILLRSFPDRLGVLNSAQSPQFDYFCYTGTPEDPYLSIPFPWLATRYNPSDLNPETLAAYRPPGLRSAVDAIIERARKEAERDQTISNKAPAALKALYEHPRAPTVERNKRKVGGKEAAQQLQPGGEVVPLQGSAYTNTHAIYDFDDAFKSANEAARKLMGTQRVKAASTQILAKLRAPYDDKRKKLCTDFDAKSDAPKSKLASDHGIGLGFANARPAQRSMDVREQSGASAADKERADEENNAKNQRKNRWRKMDDEEQITWIEKAARSAQNADDRNSISTALRDIRSKEGAERSAAIDALIKGTAYFGVADLCAKITMDDGSGGNQGGGGEKAYAGDIDRPPHPTNSGAAAWSAARGDRVTSTAKQLSEFVVNGPIDKLATQRGGIYNQLVDLSLQRPMRTDIDAMREWLDRNCPDWRNDAAVKACAPGKAAECGISLEDYSVLVGMTYEREERLRHEWMSEARAVFCAESGDEVCSTLSVTNDELSESMRGLLLHINTRKGGHVFVRPCPTFDPTLTPLATAYARDIIATYNCKSLNEIFAPQLMRLLWNERISMLRSVEGRLPDVFLLHGPPGVGKSRLFIVIKDACPPTSMLASHHRSKLSLMTISGGSINQTVTLNHEAPSVWVEGTRADPHNREQANMIKSVTTEQACDFLRNTEGPDGRRILEKYHVVYHHNAIMGTNYFTGPPDVMDRVLYVTTMSTVDNERSLATVKASFAKNGNEKRLEEVWREERWDEMAVVAIIDAMIACIALPHINLTVYDAVSAAGHAEITRFTGPITMSNRPEEHGSNQARQFVLQRTFHVYFRSEASPFIPLTTEQDPKTGVSIPRLSMHKPKEFFPRDLPAMIPTSLYCSYGEAIPAYFSSLFYKLLPYDGWRLLNVIAWRMGGFTDDYFHASYYRYGIPLPDVIGRANQRREADMPAITSRRDACSFLREYYDYFETPLRRHAEEAQLRYATVRKDKKRPMFASAKQFARVCHGIPAAHNNDDNGGGGGGGADPSKGGFNANGNYDPDLNPSLIYILLKPTLQESTAQIIQECKGILTGIDGETVASILTNLTQRPAITAPIHRAVKASEIRASELGFEGVIPPAGTAPGRDTTWFAPLDLTGQKVAYTEMPTMMFGMDAYHKRYFLAISTYALMVKWPELIYMGLTAHEGPNTRSARCILPLGHIKAPLHMHVWDTAANPYGKSVRSETATSSSATADSSENITSLAVMPGDHDARDRLRIFREKSNENEANLYNMSRHDVLDESKKEGGVKIVNPLSNMDLEMTAFVKHLVNIHYIPPRTVDQAPAEIQDILTRYAYIAPTLLCAPGNVEKLTLQLKKTCPDLKSEKYESALDDDLAYPSAFVESTQRRNDHEAAKEEFERNPEQTIDDTAWTYYLNDIFPAEGGEAAGKHAHLKKLAEQVKSIEDARKDDPRVPHHPNYPGVVLSYMIWKKLYDRVMELSKNANRIKILAENELTLIAQNAFKDTGNTDNIYDYLTVTRDKRQESAKPMLAGSARVPAAAGGASLSAGQRTTTKATPKEEEGEGDDDEQDMEDAVTVAPRDPPSRSITDAESSMEGLSRSEIDRFRAMMKAANNEDEALGLIKALSEVPGSKVAGKGPGRSGRAAEVAAAKKKQRQQRLKKANQPETTGALGEDAGDEVPHRKGRRAPNPYD